MPAMFNVSGINKPAPKKPLSAKVSNAAIGSVVNRPSLPSPSSSASTSNSTSASGRNSPTNNTVLPSHYTPSNKTYNPWSLLGRNHPTKVGGKSRKTNKSRQKKTRKNRK